MKVSKWTYIFCSLGMFLIAIDLYASEPPPVELLEGKIASCPITPPGHKGPAIGIEASPYSGNGVAGVLVNRDAKKRDLWYLGPDRRPKAARFAPDRDIILKVNNKPVRKASDVLANTHPTWNKLTIKDLGTGITSDYFVKLP